MHILQLSTYDQAGGAEKVAWNLFQTYRARGHQSRLAVGFKRTADADVLEIPHSDLVPPWAHLCWMLHGRLAPLESHVRGVWRLRYWLRVLAQGQNGMDQARGREDFHHPGSRKLLALAGMTPDIVHAHNLHGGYFDLRLLPALSRKIPVVMTLHDEWTYTGHCACTLGCERWQNGCGDCPDLTIYPPIQRDATAWNWRRKQQIYRRSHLFVATPSRWLLERVQRSMLWPIEGRVIHNGVDLTVYHPAVRAEVRAELELPLNAVILLFAATGVKSRFKDYATIREALARLHGADLPTRSVLFLALGGQEAHRERIGSVDVQTLPFQSDPARVAQYFQAADIFLHAAHADTFPNTVLESLACGTPVIATAVGGIPEQIEDGRTGFLVPLQDSMMMARRICDLLQDEGERTQMGAEAAAVARRDFDLERQADEYLGWYAEILRCGSKHPHVRR